MLLMPLLTRMIPPRQNGSRYQIFRIWNLTLWCQEVDAVDLKKRNEEVSCKAPPLVGIYYFFSILFVGVPPSFLGSRIIASDNYTQKSRSNRLRGTLLFFYIICVFWVLQYSSGLRVVCDALAWLDVLVYLDGKPTLKGYVRFIICISRWVNDGTHQTRSEESCFSSEKEKIKSGIWLKNLEEDVPKWHTLFFVPL